MKPIIKFWITSILLLFPLILTAAPKARGNVEMKDGTVYTDVEVEVPAGTMEEFKIKADNKKIKIKSDDVASLTLWHKDTPENRHLMVYTDRREVNYEKNVDKLEEFKKWFVLFSPGENVSVWIYAGGIDVSKERINMSPASSGYGYNTFYNFWKKGDPCPVFFKFNRKRDKMEEWLSKFFADDPKLTEKIKNGDYRAASTKESRRYGTMLCPMRVEDIAADYTPQP